MLLAIDVGNTNTVFALFDDDKLYGSWRCETLPKRTADEYAVWLIQLFKIEKIDISKIKASIISNVVPETSFAIESLCNQYFKTPPIIVGKTALSYGIKLFPELGADLIANAVAGYQLYRDDIIIIDFGTATTLSVIHKEGIYVGGQIAPGINLAAQALSNGASQLPKFHIEKPQHIVCQDTIEAMQSGLFWGYVGLIEKLIEQTSKEQKRSYIVIATGGLASLIAGETDKIHYVDNTLLFKGLNILYKAAQK